MNYNIALISGDGIGPEIVAEAKKVLDKVCEVYGHTFSYKEVLLGGASIDVHGVPLTEEAIADAKASDAVLMGSIGGITHYKFHFLGDISYDSLHSWLVLVSHRFSGNCLYRFLEK